jgi:hypothetical protein
VSNVTDAGPLDEMAAARGDVIDLLDAYARPRWCSNRF